MKRTIKFNLFPKKIGGVLVECRPIRMRVCYAGYRVDFRVGYSIEPEKWNEEEGRVISNTKNRFRQTAGEINKASMKRPGKEPRLPKRKKAASHSIKPMPNLWKLWAV